MAAAELRSPAQKHQREKSVDLLNQPDMLAAFLKPAAQPAEDDWASNTYHGRPSSDHYDFEEPAYMADNIEGEMAIPEAQAYTEPAPLQQYDSYGSLPHEPQDDLVRHSLLLNCLSRVLSSRRHMHG